MKAIYPMIGASAAACAQNLRSSSFTGTFTAGWTFASTGVTGNGTSTYFDTTFNPSTQITTASNFTLGGYQRIQQLREEILFGNSGGTTSPRIEQYARQAGGGYFLNIGGGFVNATNTDARGFYLGKSNSLATMAEGYKNGSLFMSGVSIPSMKNANMWLGGIQGYTAYSSNEFAFAFLGDGQLTATDVSNFYTSVQNFNQTLDRQVGAQIVSDPDAQSYINRVYTAGGTLTNLEANAVNKLAIDMKAAGLWTSMKAVYPMIGSSAASCAQNLKSSSFTGSFTAGWTFASNGVTPDGTSAYFDTNLVPSTSLLLDSVSLSFYSRTNTQGNIQMGVNDTSNYLIQQMYSSTQMYSQLNGSGGSFIDAPVTQFQGLFTTSRTSNIAVAAYKNGTNIKNDVKSSSSRPVLNFYIGARNNNNSAGNFDNKQCAFASIGDGLDDTQSSNFYTLVQSFNQTLGRSVGSQIVSDADAQAYVNRVYNAGGSLTNTEANAVNQLVLDMKTAGIWTSMKAVYPMVGSSAAACAQNLKSSSFTGSFSVGGTYSSTGYNGNGVAYMDSGIIPNTNLLLDSVHLSAYIRNNTASGGAMGCSDNGLANGLYLNPRYTNDTQYSRSNSNAGGGQANTAAAGFWLSSRISSTTFKIFKSNTTFATETISTSGRSTNNLLVGAVQLASLGIEYSDRNIAFSSIGDGLTDVQGTALYNAVQTMNITLNRQV